MVTFYNKYAKNEVYSQNGEELILQECLKRMKLTYGTCLEIGGNDGRWLSNTALLIDQGWKGKFVEADFDLWNKCCENWKDNPKVKSQCSFVDEHNVNAFVTSDIDVLSIDTDGADYRIFKAMEARPAIVIIEIDSSIPPDSETFNSEGGAPYKKMVELGIEKGYFLLCHTGNLIFILNEYRELFPEIIGDGIKNFYLYFKCDWLQNIAGYEHITKRMLETIE